jgi:omega-hydroxy-beta-dihydromenaquinone-9 sulfotransferase
MIPRGNLHEISYAEMTNDPVEALRRLYDALGLEGYESRVRPRIEATLSGKLNGYKKNDHREVDPALRLLVRQRWAAYCEAWGYSI